MWHFEPNSSVEMFPKLSVRLCASTLITFSGSLAVLRIAGALQKSTEVMKAMQNLVKVPEIQATMRELSKEMTKVSRAAKASSKCLYCNVITRNETQHHISFSFCNCVICV